MTQRDSAVRKMLACGIPVETTDYGFKILHHEVTQGSFAECGMDNDSSISLSFALKEDPPVAWFFRMDYLEMAELLIAAYQNAGGPDAARAKIIAAVRALNKDYDHTALNTMTATFLGEVEDEA